MSKTNIFTMKTICFGLVVLMAVSACSENPFTKNEWDSYLKKDPKLVTERNCDKAATAAIEWYVESNPSYEGKLTIIDTQDSPYHPGVKECKELATGIYEMILFMRVTGTYDLRYIGCRGLSFFENLNEKISFDAHALPGNLCHMEKPGLT